MCSLFLKTQTCSFVLSLFYRVLNMETHFTKRWIDVNVPGRTLLESGHERKSFFPTEFQKWQQNTEKISSPNPMLCHHPSCSVRHSTCKRTVFSLLLSPRFQNLFGTQGVLENIGRQIPTTYVYLPAFFFRFESLGISLAIFQNFKQNNHLIS